MIFKIHHNLVIKIQKMKVSNQKHPKIIIVKIQNCQIDINNFHILDIIYNKIVNVESLNIELNLLDFVTFSKFLKIIYNAPNLTSLRCSIFSSDIVYRPRAIYKISNQNYLSKIIKPNPQKKKGVEFRMDIEFYQEIYPFFVRYMNYFFEIIKKKKLQLLGLNIDIPPSIIYNNNNYNIIIIKFIINILILYIKDNKSQMKELLILSPALRINGNEIIIFDKFLENINDCKLNYLNLELKFYNIRNLHKLIGNNLQILKIGNFDIFSLKYFVENISKYKFYQNTNLIELTIQLDKSITTLNDELLLILAKLFNVKIKSLIYIYFYSRIILNQKDFEKIVYILDHNLISIFLLIFHDSSSSIINKNIKLIDKLSCVLSKEFNQNIYGNNDAFEIYWYLLYLFNKKYKEKSLDFFAIKKLISIIFKYLYVPQQPKVKFSL